MKKLIALTILISGCTTIEVRDDGHTAYEDEFKLVRQYGDVQIVLDKGTGYTFIQDE